MPQDKELNDDQRMPASFEAREERLILANRFLYEVLVPMEENEEFIGDSKIVQGNVKKVLKEFQKENVGPGSDFDLGIVWALAREQNSANNDIQSVDYNLIPANASTIAALEYILECIIQDE